jgi:hypothetical protein
MNKIRSINALLKEDESLKYAKPTVKENTPVSVGQRFKESRLQPVSVGLNMDQTDAVYKVLEDNFGEEHMKDMFTLGSLSFYNMMVKGGIAGVFKRRKL